MTDAAIDKAARTAWGEARDQGELGMQAVINVIMKRVALGWGGKKTVESVCLAPKQFSCWLPGDPNLPKLQSVDDTDPQFALALDLADKAINSYLPDITNGADSYYSRKIMAAPPYWARGLVPCATIKNHLFFVTRKRKDGPVLARSTSGENS